MDPLSITTACLTLLSAVAATSSALTTFIRGCREARSDLTSISGELSQLKLVLDLLKDDAAVISDDRVIPEPLQRQLLSTIKNCSAVMDNINTVLRKHSGKSGATKWVTSGKAEVAGLRMSLEAHRGSLSLVLELVSVSISRAILDDVAVVRTGVHDIKQHTVQIPQIMAELTRIRAIVTEGEMPPTISGQNYVLQQYLDGLTSYAETVCNEASIPRESDAAIRSNEASRRTSLEESRRDEQPTAAALQNHDSSTSEKPATAQESEQIAEQMTPRERMKAPETAISSSSKPDFKRKVVLVGDKNVGKSAFIGAFLKARGYPEMASASKKHVADVKVDSKRVELTIMESNRLRYQHYGFQPLSYDDADVLLVCFAINIPSSLDTLQKWFRVIETYYKGTPTVLVGLKISSVRPPPTGLKSVAKTEAERLARRWDAVKYLEVYCAQSFLDHFYCCKLVKAEPMTPSVGTLKGEAMNFVSSPVAPPIDTPVPDSAPAGREVSDIIIYACCKPGCLDCLVLGSDPDCSGGRYCGILDPDHKVCCEHKDERGSYTNLKGEAMTLVSSPVVPAIDSPLPPSAPARREVNEWRAYCCNYGCMRCADDAFNCGDSTRCSRLSEFNTIAPNGIKLEKFTFAAAADQETPHLL